MTPSTASRIGAALACGALLLASTTPMLAQTMTGAYGNSAGAGFGGATAVGDGVIFVGSAPVGWQTGDEPPGIVYRYVRSGDGSWVEAAGLMASDGVIGDHFGRTVLLHGRGDNAMVVVGAPGIGAAYVFEPNGTDWRQTGKLVPSQVAEGTEFGGAYARAGNRTQNIAVAGDRIAVTSFGADSGANAVHVFRKDGASWIEETVLWPDASDTEEDAYANFAYAIAGAESHLFVSASGASGRRGTVHVYRRSGETWSHAGRVVNKTELDERASLGQTVAFDVSTGNLFAGAPYQGGVGAVFGFANDGGTWVESGTFALSQNEDDERPRIGLGNALAVAAGRIVAGARGAAFVMSFEDGTVRELTPPDDRARAGFGVGLAIRGNVAVVGSPSADYEEGIATVYEYSPGSGEWVFVSTLASEISYLSSLYGEQIDCEEGSANVFSCNNVDLLAFMSAAELRSERGVKMTDIWGWEDPETGKEWVVLGRTDGTAFVDISDPNNPVYVGQLYRTEGSPGSAWRDVKVYENHAYIVADGAREHGVQIFDLTQLRSVSPADMPVTFEATAHYDGTGSTHNIVINEETGYAYAVGNGQSENNTCGGQLHIFDVREPANPKFAGCFSTGRGGTHDAQCVIYRGADADYVGREICFASNGSAFAIADVTDKDSTRTLANTSYPNQAYTHQGWLTEDHNYFFMNDELDEMNGSVDRTRTLIWDVTDLEDPQLVKEYFLNSGASDHNLYIRDGIMYQSNYQSGLRVIDVRDPLNPVEIGHFDTAPYAEDAAGFGGSWSNYPYFDSGVIAVSSRGEGLFLLRKRPIDM